MENAIQIFKEYPRDKFIPLVPVQTITQISPLHRVNINVVQISTDERDRDTYKEKNGELALTKKALMKLMATANIQIIESKSVTPSSCQRCLEMAKNTGKACPCGGCECKNDIAWQVTIAVPDLSGGVRRVTATREFICADERKKAASEKQYEQAFAFRAAHTESKALNRALRAALMIKSTYRADELAKPFAVPVISLNFEDPDLKAAMIQRCAMGEDSLYGKHESGEQQQHSLPEHSVIEIPPGEPDDYDNDVLSDVGDEPELPDGFDVVHAVPEIIECDECGAIIKAFKDNRTGEEWNVKRIVDHSTEHFGAALCPVCIAARMKKGASAGKKGAVK